jgi:hypothetical protein
VAPIFIRLDLAEPEEGQPKDLYVQVAHIVGFYHDPLGKAGACITASGYDGVVAVIQTVDQIRILIYNEILRYK